MRGPLALPRVPLSRTRAERFDDLLLDVVEALEARWAAELSIVDFAVEEVPPVNAPRMAPDVEDTLSASDVGSAVVADSYGHRVRLSRLVPASHGSGPRIIVYRRPLEMRAANDTELGALVHRVVVAEFASILGLEPEKVDPALNDDED